MKVLWCFAMLAAFLCPGAAWADCFDDAAQYDGVNQWVLRGIAAVESGKGVSATAPESELMKGLEHSNSAHPKAFEGYNVPKAAYGDTCMTIHLAGWRLRLKMDAAQGDLWLAVGQFDELSGRSAAAFSRNVQSRLMPGSGGPTTVATGPADLDACFEGAAARHHVNAWVLRAIAAVESEFNPKAVNINHDKAGRVTSADFGMMEINSGHLPELGRYGIAKQDLFDACTSVYVGAWIYRKAIDQYGDNWFAAGAYNSATPVYNTIYQGKLKNKLRSWGKL